MQILFTKCSLLRSIFERDSIDLFHLALQYQSLDISQLVFDILIYDIEGICIALV